MFDADTPGKDILVQQQQNAAAAAANGNKKPRAKHACRECNARRIRCNVTEAHPCSNCRSSNARCEVVPSRRGRYPRRSRLQKQLQEAGIHAVPIDGGPPSASTIHVSPAASPMERAAAIGGPSATSSTELTPPTSTGNLFFGESNFLTLVPGPSPSDSDGQDAPPPRKSRLSFAIPSTPQSQTSESSTPAPPTFDSVLKDHYLANEDALSFPPLPAILPALRAYFQHFHPCFPILSRRLVTIQLISTPPTISPLLLNAMLFIGSTYCPLSCLPPMGFPDRSHAKSAFYTRTLHLHHADAEPDTLTLIQALFLASFWRGGPEDRRDVRYWLGTVITLAEGVGMHRQTRFSTRDEGEKRIRRRIWWSVYVRERQSAASLGLPSRIRDQDCDIEPLTAADLVSVSDSNPHGRDVECQWAGDGGLAGGEDQFDFGTTTPEHVTYVIKMVDIARLLGRIIDIHFVPGRAPPPPAETSSVADLAAALEAWKTSLPPEMRGGPEDGQTGVWTCLLHLAYNHLRILIHRNGFLSTTSSNDSGPSSVDRSEALSAACRISRIAEDMLTQGTLPHGQMHLITALFAALCIHTISIRGASAADGVGRRISELRAQMCLLGLKEVQKYWRINNNVLDLFLRGVGEGVKRRLVDGKQQEGCEDGDGGEEEEVGDEESPVSRTDTGKGSLDSTFSPSASAAAALPQHHHHPGAGVAGMTLPLGQTIDVFEDQYLNFLHASWAGGGGDGSGSVDGHGQHADVQAAVGDLGSYLDPQLYVPGGGMIQGEGLAFLERSL